MLVNVNLKPNVRHDERVEVLASGELIVRVKAPPVEGRANQRAIELLARHYRVPKSQVRLVRGTKAKVKVFEIIT